LKAAVCYEFGAPLVIEEVTLDAPKTDEVRVRLAATAVCHSDVHLLGGDWAGALPVVAGHEAAGIVEEIGEHVTLVKPGDRVVVSLLRTCGRCDHCSTGSSHNCDGVFPLDKESRLRNARGEVLQQGIKVGAFAEAVVVDQSQCVRIPDEMPLDRAALLGCGVITGTGAVFNTARIPAGATVAVIGTGGVGLNTIQAAALAGASRIIALDPLASKLEAAKAFGATETTSNPKSIRDVDYAFVTVGNPDAVVSAMRMIRRGGTVVVVGMPGVRGTAPIRIFDLVWSEQRLIGSRMGSTRLHVDIPRLIDLYLRGRLKLDELISGRYELDGINDAIEAMKGGAVLRNLIVFG
jgi:S-(hydroxymethyl)glutathione dehydrogenase / alcohol dehydrogenase